MTEAKVVKKAEEKAQKMLEKRKVDSINGTYRVEGKDLRANDLVKFNENGTVSLAESSFIYADFGHGGL